MNANELADELEKGGGHYMLNIASILRQQVNQIADLEKQVAELTEQNDRFYEELGKNYE